MNRGLRPVIDSIKAEGCPFCGEEPKTIDIQGPDDIRLEGCGHVVDVKQWADSRYEQSKDDLQNQ